MFLRIPHFLSVENITIHDGETMFAELAARLNPFVAPLSYQLLHSFDLFGTIVFASIGALVAYEQRRNGIARCYMLRLQRWVAVLFAMFCWASSLCFGCDRPSTYTSHSP